MIRPAMIEDVPAVATLEQENLGRDAWSPSLVEQGIRGRLPTIHYLVADVDGELVGHAVASVVADVAELQRIAVTPARRRTGLASQLLDHVTMLAGMGGAERLLLEVREDNAGALQFYAAHRFAELDRRRGYYADGTTAVVLARSLAGPRTMDP